MADETTSPVAAAKRQLAFLSTFDKKFEGFRREMERLRRASVTGKPFGGKWPTDGLERIAGGIVGAGEAYGLPEVGEWAGGFLARLGAIRAASSAPTAEDMEGLAAQIRGLELLHGRLAGAAAAATGQPAQPRGAQPARIEEEPARRESRPSDAPFIAPSRTTEPPPPPAGEEPQPARPPVRPIPASAVMYSHPPPIPKRPSRPPPAPGGAAPAGGERREPSVARGPGRGGRPLAYVVVAQPSVREGVTEPLGRAGFDVRAIADPRELAPRIGEEAPDLVVVDCGDAPPAGRALAGALGRDPLTDFVPVLCVGGDPASPRGNEIPKPVDPERLLALARRLTGPGVRAAHVTTGLGEPTLVELLEFVNDELRAGVIDAASGRASSERIRIASEGKLMAAVWGLIAQIRRSAEEGTRGRLRFMSASSGQLGMMALAEADQLLDGATAAEASDVDISSLKGTVAVVADDDPAVRDAFERALGEVGVRVHLVDDGRRALDVVRGVSPDLIISDILMPAMDGWELCNRLRSDASLRHIPVILLSWKEDFLERLRGLAVDADDFMLKEVDRKQIVARAANALRPRFVLERQLGIAGDVRGRIERLGVLPVLSSAAKLRPNCRISLRETWNYFEADLRGGELMAVTRTGSDGTYGTGAQALERLLCAAGGSFAVVDAADTPARQFPEGAQKAISEACRRLNGLVAKVTDGALIGIGKIGFDEAVLRLSAQIMPPKLRVPLERLVSGASPREIILAREASPEALESLLLDLVRVGAVTRIEASGGRVPAAVPGAPAPALPARAGGASPVWKWVAVAAVVLLAASVGVSLSQLPGGSAPSEGKVEPAPAPGPEPAPAPEPEPAPAPGPVAAPVPEPVAAPVPEPVAAKPAPVAKPARKSDAPDLPDGSGSPVKPATPDEPDEPAAPADTGKLTVTLPPDAEGPIAVSIDGSPRGNAPVTVTLPPGLHEVVFTGSAGRALRMVSLRSGDSKTVAARVGSP